MRLSYLVPTALLVSVVVYARTSWWAVALLVGGAKFGLDWLWGDRRLLLASYGLRQSVIGCVLIVLGVLLAQGLGISMAELHETARGLRESERVLYRLPAIGIGVLLYGCLIWSRAWSEQRD